MKARFEIDAELFSPPSEKKSFGSSNKRQPAKEITYSIYTIETLSQLFVEQNRGHEATDLRFLVDMSGFLWFARETHDSPAPHAPPHCKLANDNPCRTAGNLFFNERRNTLLKINHKSGDYRPTYESQNWLLAILVLNEELLPFRLPERLQIERLNHAGECEETNLIALESIRTWVKTLDPDLFKKLIHQPSVIKEVKVSPPERAYQLLAKDGTPLRGRSLFGSMGMFSTNTGAGAGSDDEEVLEGMNRGRKYPRLLDSPEKILLL